MKKIVFSVLSIVVLTITVLLLANYTCFPYRELPENAVIDKIIVEKSKKTMKVYQDGTLLKTYRCALGKRSKYGKKEVKGDYKTPEGIYTIDAKNPNSVAYKNLGISYPNAEDSARAKELGKPPGGDIKIHGFMNDRKWEGRFHYFRNWTAGCIAVTNREMDELYRSVIIDAVIEIRK
jgi:murein L,D-transpeptidase YafK